MVARVAGATDPAPHQADPAPARCPGMAKMSAPFAMLDLIQKAQCHCTMGNCMSETLGGIVDVDVEELAPGLLRL